MTKLGGKNLKFIHTKTFRWLVVATFLLYMAILFNLVFFSSEFGRVNSEVLRYQKINLIPFRTIKNYISVRDYIDSTVVITNIFGNILAFMPFGFLLPIVLKARRKLLWFFLCFH